MTLELGRTIQYPLTNKSGGAVAQGDVVVLDSSNAAAFTTTTTAGYVSGLIGVVIEPNGIANNGTGMVVTAGPVPKINLSSSAGLGNLLRTASIAKQAAPHSAPFQNGDFGQVLGTGTTPAAILFGSNNSSAALSTANPYSLFQARLTLTSGTPVTISDVTGAATIYLTPFRGNQIGLYTGGVWEVLALTEISLSLSGLIKGVCYDIFVYDSSGAALEAVAWKKVTATSSPTSGSSKVLSLADTAGLVVGQKVTVKDGSSSEIATVSAVSANTSITVASLANSYTLPDVYGYPTRATALTNQDGVPCKNGALDRRYAGTIVINSTGGQTEDSAQRRLVWNNYNRGRRKLSWIDTTSSWTYSSATIRQARGQATNQVEFVLGLQEDAVELNYNMRATVTNVANAFAYAGIGLDTTTVQTVFAVLNPLNTSTTLSGVIACQYEDVPTIGYHYAAMLEQADGSHNITVFGNGESFFGGSVLG